MPKSKKSKNNSKKNDNITWENYGKVYSYSHKNFIRLGTIKAFNVIKNELIRNSQFFKINLKFKNYINSYYAYSIK